MRLRLIGNRLPLGSSSGRTGVAYLLWRYSLSPSLRSGEPWRLDESGIDGTMSYLDRLPVAVKN
jgi:hypothetical protein